MLGNGKEKKRKREPTKADSITEDDDDQEREVKEEEIKESRYRHLCCVADIQRCRSMLRGLLKP